MGFGSVGYFLYLCAVMCYNRIIHRIGCLAAALCVVASAVSAQSLASTTDETQQAVEMRARVSFNKSLPYGLSFTLQQDLRARLMEYAYPAGAPLERAYTDPYIQRMYTTLSLGYEPIEYLHLEAGYILRLYGDRWDRSPREFIRHRATFAVTGQYRYRQWKFSFGEQIDVNCRMDSVNPLEQNKVDLTLRHILKTDYSFAGTPWQLKGKVELHNTLNSPTAYLREVDPAHHYGQYLSSARVEIGAKWKITDMHALTLVYRYQWEHKRDIEIVPSGDVMLTNTSSHVHIISLTYDLDW